MKFIVFFGVASLFFICLLSPRAVSSKEVKVSLSSLSEVVVEAAKNAVAGIVLEDEAEVLKKDSVIFYEIDGVANGKKYEIHVDEKGKVLKAALDD